MGNLLDSFASSRRGQTAESFYTLGDQELQTNHKNSGGRMENQETGKPESQNPECRNAGMPEWWNAGIPEFRNAGKPECRKVPVNRKVLVRKGKFERNRIESKGK